MIACWSIKGGTGVSVVVAGMAMARAGREPADDTLVVDLQGDQPCLLGAPAPPGPGVAGWLAAGEDVPDDALHRLAHEVAAGVHLLPAGTGPLPDVRSAALADALQREGPGVVVDVGVASDGALSGAVLAEASTSLLVVRACPLTLERLDHLPAVPTGVIVVRDRRRSVTWRQIGAAAEAPVVAELELDPAVAASVDGGVLHRPLPRRFLRVLGELV